MVDNWAHVVTALLPKVAYTMSSSLLNLTHTPAYCTIWSFTSQQTHNNTQYLFMPSWAWRETIAYEVYWTMRHCDNRRVKKPTRCHFLFYCNSYRLNMFRALLYPSSGAHDYDVDYHIGRFILGLLYLGG